MYNNYQKSYWCGKDTSDAAKDVIDSEPNYGAREHLFEEPPGNISAGIQIRNLEKVILLFKYGTFSGLLVTGFLIAVL